MNFPTFLCATLIFTSAIALATENERLTYVGDVEDIREDALTLHDGINATIQSTVYPELRFTCAGSISSVWFVASESEGVGSAEPIYAEYLLWRGGRVVQNAQISVYTGTVIRDRRSPPSSGEGLSVETSGEEVSLYQYVLEDPMTFQEGDVFGINQNVESTLEILSLDSGGVRNYRLVSIAGRLLARAYAPDGRFDLEPLVALEGMNSSCIEGFLNAEALQLYVETIDEDSDATEHNTAPDVIPNNTLSYVFPSLQVVEDGLLEKWIFAADIMRTLPAGQEPLSIDFQIWRGINGTASLEHTSSVTDTIRSGYPNVYEYTVDPPRPVLTGDFIGIKVQLPSSLRPLWRPGNGTGYYLMSGTEGAINSLNFAGFSHPLFAAQIKVTEQMSPFPTSSPVGLIIPSESLLMSRNMVTTSAAGPLFSSLSPTSTASFITPTPSLISYLPAAFPVPIEVTSLTQTLNTPQPTASPDTSNSVSSPSGEEEGRTVAVVVTVILLLVLATVATSVLVLCLWRKRRHISKRARPRSLPRQKSKSGFFDNPVYDQLQRKLSKDSQGYSSIYDHVYLEVPEEKAVERGDGDSGYAEPEIKITTTTLQPGGRSRLSASPSPCNSPHPRGSPSPCPSPARSPAPAATPIKFHAYHTLDSCSAAEEYLEPRPTSVVGGSSEHFLRKATCSQEDISTSSCGNVEHEYHELEPTTGGYHRLQHNLTGIYVPTQAQRRESVDNEDIYTSIEERMYADVPDSSTLDFFEERASYWRPACTTDELYSQLAQNKYREILYTHIRMQHVLGSGNFGNVRKGEWQCGEGLPVEVAIKTLKSGSSEEEVLRFLQEAAIMGQFRHPNIVQLLGVVTLAERVMIVLEFLSQGDLGTFLVNRRPMAGSSVPQDTPFLLLGFCKDVASGMEYLERKAFVHRDLAARNILVSEDNHCKIGDFGLSRDLLDENYYITKGGMIPWRWTAPEALHYRKYSTASDVWSFGCLMYEIWSLGHAPFEKLSPQEMMLEKGERLAPPPGCPRGVYSLMIDCWHPEHSMRPFFLSLLKTLASSPSQLLSWSHEDTWGAADVIILGAPLEAGKQLYPELQHTYTQKSHQLAS